MRNGGAAAEKRGPDYGKIRKEEPRAIRKWSSSSI